MKFNYLFSLFIMISFNSLPAQTGIPEPGLTSCDTFVQTFISTYDIPGLSIAISKDGKLVYNRAFGKADLALSDTLYPYHLFRIASNTKPITSATIMKLLDDGLVNMDDLIFGAGGILENHPFLSTATITDNDIYDITVQNLLEHSAGWDRSINCYPDPTSPYPLFYTGCDPLIAPLHVAESNGTTNPIDDEDNIYFLLEKGLNFTPGTQYAYSNVGFLILGEVIEELTNMSYHQYVKTQIFDSIHACDMYMVKNLLAEKWEREVEYIGDGNTSLDCYGNNTNVPWEYGGLNIESFDAASGWVTTTRDFLRLLTSIDGFATVPDILSPAAISVMTTPSANNVNYAKGWQVNEFDNWWHIGSLDGNATIVVRTSGGFTWAIFLNKRVIGAQAGSFWSDLDNLPWDCIGAATSYPAHDLFATPQMPSSDIHFSVVDNTSCQINWTNGGGTKRIIVGKAGSPVDMFPVDGISYAANTNFGSGADFGSDNFVLYDDLGTSATVTNLTGGTTYYFRIFEYNQNATTGNYKLYLLPKSQSNIYYSGCIDSIYIPEVLQDLTKAGLVIQSDATINRFNTIFQAGQEVELLTGFAAEAGFTFEANIENCN